MLGTSDILEFVSVEASYLHSIMRIIIVSSRGLPVGVLIVFPKICLLDPPENLHKGM